MLRGRIMLERDNRAESIAGRNLPASLGHHSAGGSALNILALFVLVRFVTPVVGQHLYVPLADAPRSGPESMMLWVNHDTDCLKGHYLDEAGAVVFAEASDRDEEKGILQTFRLRFVDPESGSVLRDAHGHRNRREYAHSFQVESGDDGTVRLTLWPREAGRQTEPFKLRQAAETVRGQWESDFLRCRVRYPNFSLWREKPFFAAVNEYFGDRAQEYIKEVVPWRAEPNPDYRDYQTAAAVSTDDMLASVVTFTPTLASVLWQRNRYGAGAAHPAIKYEGEVLALRDGQIVRLTQADIFGPGLHQKACIRDLCARELRALGAEWQDIEGKPGLTNFYLTPRCVVYVFNEYEVGSGKAGAFFVQITFEEVLDLIDSRGPLASLPEVQRLVRRTYRLAEPEAASAKYPVRWTGQTPIQAETPQDLVRLLSAPLEPQEGHKLVLTDPEDTSHKTEVTSVLQYMYLWRRLGYYAATTFDMGILVSALKITRPLCFLLTAKASETSHVADLDLSSDELTLPLNLIPQMKGDELGDSLPKHDVKWREFFRGADWEATWPHELGFEWRDIWVSVHIMCWGDANEDGIEDVMLSVCTGARQGTGFTWRFPVMTRLTKGGPLKVAEWVPTAMSAFPGPGKSAP